MCSFIVTFWCLSLLIGISNCQESDSLVLVIGVFRNGQGTPGISYPKDPNINQTYPPYRQGLLVNDGVRSSIELGRFFQNNYGNFLGNSYEPGVVNASAEDPVRTRSSLEHVLASIWPSHETPIPYNNLPSLEWSLLSYPAETCPAFDTLYDSYMNTFIGRLIEAKYSYFYDYLQGQTGLNTTSLSDLPLLYYILTGEDDYGLTLPDWTKFFYPDILREAVIDYYRTATATPELRRITGGFLLGRIVYDIQRKINNDPNFNKTKLILYSGQVYSVAFNMIVLNVFFPHIPSYNACVIIELHKINGIYGIRILYKQINDTIPTTLTISGCTTICPFSHFLYILQNNIPQSNNPCNFI